MIKKYKLDGDTKREYTTEEYAQAEIDEQQYVAEQAKKEQDNQQKETKKAAALAKLEILGLDVEDLKALGLG